MCVNMKTTIFLLMLTCTSWSNKSVNIDLNKEIVIRFKKLNAMVPEFSTNYSNIETIVLQILPEVKSGTIVINNVYATTIQSWFYIPKVKSGYYIMCPFVYFQTDGSFPGKWINNDIKQKITLTGIDSVKKVLITYKSDNIEEVMDLPQALNLRLLEYLKLDINNNLDAYSGFDCYAFASLISNVKYFPPQPDFNFDKSELKNGDVVVLSDSEDLPNSIKHWAIYLGKGVYLSKFGKNGDGTGALVQAMDLSGMMKLYKCKYWYRATPKKQARLWDGYKPQTSDNVNG